MKFRNLRYIAPFLLPAILWGCASVGNPSGGPRDEDPPRFIRANPKQGAVNVPVDLNKAVIDFNEIVNIKDAFSKVIISPVAASIPRVTAQGRRVTIEFQDSLQPNTTYTVDFSDAIEDNNEGNKLPGFFYSFSTGEHLDSLEISGMVLAARNLEPQKEMIVGIHSNLADSAFYTLPFERIAKTDESGRFTISGLAPGTYNIFALNDLDNDRKYANPEEDIAFLPFSISPSAERITVTDTILNLKTGAVDTIVERTRTRYLPNDILLRSFNTEKRTQFLQEYIRPDSMTLRLRFNAKAEQPPTLKIPLFPELSEQIILERSATNDTLTYWLPPQLAAIDSIIAETTFLRPDSAGNLVSGTDILEFVKPIIKVPKKKENKKKKEEENARPAVPVVPELKVTLPGAIQEVWRPLTFSFSTPPAYLDTTSFRLETKVDTLWKPVGKQPLLHLTDSLSPRRFSIDYPWEFGTSYRLVADSAAVTGLYGEVMRPLSHEFSTKTEEEYSSLLFNISGIAPQEHFFVELLSGSDTPVRVAEVENGKVAFRYLDPGVYYARLIEDFNGNGVFDPGDPARGLPPDQAFYYPSRINLKKNWDLDQSWAPFDTPVDLQKPDAIKQNKPKGGHSNGEQTEEEEEEIFDPTANPFDPVQERKRKEQRQRQLNGY